MNEPIDRTLEEAAEAVADQRPLDWGGTTSKHPELSATLDELRRLESLARAHLDARDAAAADRGPASASPRAEPAFTWGTLQALEKLGEGTFGEVWRAYDPALGREVGLKLRRESGGDPAGTRRWLEEGRRLARLRHAGVLAVHGAAEHDGRAGLWTELIRGETLGARLAAQGRFGAREAALVGMDLCAALSAVHAAGLVHGDVTAANVMREGAGSAGPGRIVLMDFGSGHEIAAGNTASAFGTPLACAPEVLRGEPATARADLYSLGALLFRLLSGRHPFEAASFEELSARHASGQRPSLRALRPDLPPALCAAVERSLEQDPARRFAEAGEFERALAAVLETPAGREAATAERAPWRRPALLWLPAAAAVVLLGMWLAQRPPSRPAGSPAGEAGGEAAPAPAATPAPAPPAAVPAPWVVEAALVRRTSAGSEALTDGSRLALGDRLALEVRCPEPAWVYVLDEDQSGQTFALFPLAGLSLSNPLPANVRHRLPGALRGRPFAWQVTSEGGEERFLVVVSRRRLPLVESQIAALERARPDAGTEPLAAAVDTLRGVGGLAEDVYDGPASGDTRLQRLARRLERGGDPDLWVRVLLLNRSSP